MSARSILKSLKGGASLNCGQKRKLESALINIRSDQVRIREAAKNVRWIKIHSAFLNRIQTAAVINLTHTNPTLFLNEALALTRKRLKKVLQKFSCVKINFVLTCEHIKPPDINTTYRKYFSSRNYKLYSRSRILDLKRSPDESQKEEDELIVSELLKKLSEFAEKGSGFALKSIINLTVNISSVCKFASA